MQEQPSARCGDCIWSKEDAFMCEGCPNNPEIMKKMIFTGGLPYGEPYLRPMQQEI